MAALEVLPVSCDIACVLARASDAAWSELVFLSTLCLWFSSISYEIHKYSIHTERIMNVLYYSMASEDLQCSSKEL